MSFPFQVTGIRNTTKIHREAVNLQLKTEKIAQANSDSRMIEIVRRPYLQNNRRYIGKKNKAIKAVSPE
jgi:predicted Zn-dependent peptidase